MMAEGRGPTLDETDLPGLWMVADARAKRSQSTYWLLLGLELTLVALAAIGRLIFPPFGAGIAAALGLRPGSVQALGLSFDSHTVAAQVGASVIPAALIILAIAAAGLRFTLQPDAQWRRQRALAEAVVSLAWRYSMGALPGDLAATSPGGHPDDTAYLQEYETLVDGAKGLDLPLSDAGVRITGGMRDLRRQADVEQKRAAYRRGRLDQQRGFYAVRTERYRTRRNRLRVFMIAAYVAAVPLLVVNGLGAMTTVAGALGTWLASRHYDELFQSYGGMERKLDGRIAMAGGLALNGPGAQAEWARFVDQVESLLEGEHRQWLVTVGRLSA